MLIMKRKIFLILMLIIFTFFFCYKNEKKSQASTGDENNLTASIPYNITNDNIARFISGIPSNEESYKNIEAKQIWQNYALMIRTNWSRIESNRFQIMRNWAQTELADSRKDTKVLFNAFGGPDFITPYILYPNAQTNILFGLEPIGNLPEISKLTRLQLTNYLGSIKYSLRDFFKKSYFITKNMMVDLYSTKADGVLPLILIFLKKENCYIGDLNRIYIDPLGNLIEIPFTINKKKLKTPNGVKITFFTKDSTTPKIIYYFSCEVQDVLFTPKTPLYKFFAKMNNVTTFVKSASYLMHYGTFANIRKLILDKSQYIFEDDTGIPYRYFNKKEWEIKLYGIYAKPVSDFTGVEQADLKKIYKDNPKATKLPFHLGYHWWFNTDAWLYCKKIPVTNE